MATVDHLRVAGLEMHLVVRRSKPGLGDFDGVVDGFLIVEERLQTDSLNER